LLQLWARRQLDAVTVTSSEGLRNLFDMIGSAGQTALQKRRCLRRICASSRRRAVSLAATGADGRRRRGTAAGMIDYFSSPEHD